MSRYHRGMPILVFRLSPRQEPTQVVRAQKGRSLLHAEVRTLVAVGVLTLTLGCGSEAAPAPSASPAATTTTPPPAPTPAPPAATPVAPAAPTETASSGASLASLLPPAPDPITLAHARALAQDGTWLEAAAVYDALARATPDDARVLAGRGFALASSGDARAEPLARTDYEHALALADDDATRALVHYDLGLLDEHAGHLDDARAHYAEANRLRPSRPAAEALERIGDARPPDADQERECSLEPARAAEAVPDLRGVVALLVRTREEAERNTGDADPAPATEEEARALLCHPEPCDVSSAFVSDLVQGDIVVQAHVVVPRPSGGYWVIPRVRVGSGRGARCPDEMRRSTEAALERPGATALTRARVSSLVNEYSECFDDEDEDCAQGCSWSAREVVELLVDPDTGRYVEGSAQVELEDEGTGDGSVLLPPDAFRLVDGAVVFTGCDGREPVTL